MPLTYLLFDAGIRPNDRVAGHNLEPAHTASTIFRMIWPSLWQGMTRESFMRGINGSYFALCVTEAESALRQR